LGELNTDRIVITRLATAGAIVVVLFLAGCSSTNAEVAGVVPTPNGPKLFETPQKGAEWARAQGFDLMAQQLDDGTISAEEYEASFVAHNSCLEKTGWTFDAAPAVWNPVDHVKLIRQGVAPQSPDIAGQLLCDEQFDYVDFLFQTTTTPKMDLPLLSAVQSCLEEKNVPYFTGAINLSELVGPDAGSSSSANLIADCVSTQAKRLYPEIPAISIAF